MLKTYSNQVSITGIGIASPVGTNLEEFYGALCQGKRQKYLNEKKEIVIGEAARERLLCMCSNAIERAIIDWGGNIHHYEEITLIVGSGLGYTDAWSEDIGDPNQFWASFITDIKERLSFSVDALYFANACCAGSQALCYGADLVGYGFRELVIVGGVDIYSDIAEAGFRRLNALDVSGCKPFLNNRRGISIGEGAAFFILERDKCARYGSICGYGVTSDALDVVRMEPSGTYVRNAICQAIEMAEIDVEDIDLIISHGTGTLQNDQIESNVIWDLFNMCDFPPYVLAPKGVIGHTGGASGAFGLIAAIVVWIHSTIPSAFGVSERCEDIKIPLVNIGTKKRCCKYSLVNCFGFGGTNSVIVWKG